MRGLCDRSVDSRDDSRVQQACSLDEGDEVGVLSEIGAGCVAEVPLSLPRFTSHSTRHAVGKSFNHHCNKGLKFLELTRVTQTSLDTDLAKDRSTVVQPSSSNLRRTSKPANDHSRMSMDVYHSRV